MISLVPFGQIVDAFGVKQKRRREEEKKISKIARFAYLKKWPKATPIYHSTILPLTIHQIKPLRLCVLCGEKFAEGVKKSSEGRQFKWYQALFALI